MEDEELVVEESPQERKQRNWWLIIALVAAVAAGILLASSVWDNRWNSENAVGNELVENTGSDPQAWCAAQATYDAMRRELFRRAAQVRGSDEQAFTRLSDFAILRVSGPIVRDFSDQLQSVTCSGTAHLDLPPGVSTDAGRRSLSGDVDYMVQPAADGTGNVVRLGNADSIVIPLATLSRRGAPETAPLVPPDLEDQVIDEPLPSAEEEEGLPPPESGDTSSPAVANPSFDCNRARTRSEIAVCRDPGLAALDRQMAAQFSGAMNRADSGQRRLLNRTRGRFLSYRDRCATNQCIAETYRSRMREISDIMAGRWRG